MKELEEKADKKAEKDKKFNTKRFNALTDAELDTVHLDLARENSRNKA